jgi:hypothetical protein
VVEEALVAGGVRLGALGAFEQVSQPLAGDPGREFSDEDTAFDDDRDGRQGHPDGGDADRGLRVGLVADQPIVRVGLVQVVQHRGELEQAQHLVERKPVQVVVIAQGGVSHGRVISVGRQPSSTRTS